MYAKMKLLKKQLPSPRARRMDLYMVSSFLILARNTELPDWYSAMFQPLLALYIYCCPRQEMQGLHVATMVVTLLQCKYGLKITHKR